jgi:hypothetical protein
MIDNKHLVSYKFHYVHASVVGGGGNISKANFILVGTVQKIKKPASENWWAIHSKKRNHYKMILPSWNINT